MVSAEEEKSYLSGGTKKGFIKDNRKGRGKGQRKELLTGLMLRLS